jgi:hypothetical protein
LFGADGRGCSGRVLDGHSTLVQRIDNVEREAWRVFVRRMRKIAGED